MKCTQESLPTPMNRRQQTLIALGACFIACLDVYGISLSYGFIELDDPTNIFRNPLLNPPTWSHCLHFWTHGFFSMYIPLTYTAWSLVAYLSERIVEGHLYLRPGFFHAANLVLHGLNSFLVFLVLRGWLERLRPPAKSSRVVPAREREERETKLANREWTCALAGALLFAWHPVQVEAVGWITGMRDLLSVCLALTALRFYYRYLDARRDKFLRKRKEGAEHLLQISLGFFVLSLLAKPGTALLPGALFIVDTILLGLEWRGTAKRLFPWAGLGAGSLILAKLLQPNSGIINVTPWWTRPFIAGDALFFYLKKLFFPFFSGFDYGRTPHYVLGHSWVYLTWIVPAAVAFLCWRHRKHARWLPVASLLFVLGLFPVLGFVPFDFQIFSTVCDHYLYFSMLGVGLAFAAGMSWTLERFSGVAWVAAGLLFVLSITSQWQLGYWKDSFSLFTHAIDANPDSVISATNLGAEEFERKRYADAERLYAHAAELRPDLAEVHLAWGSALLMEGRSAESISHFQDALTRNPQLVTGYIELADALENLGRTADELAALQAATRLDPQNPTLLRALNRLSEKRAPASSQNTQ